MVSSVTTKAGDDVSIEVVVVVVVVVVEEVDVDELVELADALADDEVDKVVVCVAEIVDEPAPVDPVEPATVDPVATGPNEELPVEDGPTDVLIEEEAEPVVTGIGAVDTDAVKSVDEGCTIDVAVADALLPIAVDTGMELVLGASVDDCAMVVATSK